MTRFTLIRALLAISVLVGGFIGVALWSVWIAPLFDTFSLGGASLFSCFILGAIPGVLVLRWWENRKLETTDE
jgi:hypothetical protein